MRSLDGAILIYDPEYMAENHTLRPQGKSGFFIHGEGAMLIREFFRDAEPRPHGAFYIVLAIAAKSSRH